MFHVFVEGAKDASPAGRERLAQAMAAHYGMPVADVTARLQSGRFRAKGNCDRATAEQYARDLDRLGARCTIEEANAQNSRPTPRPFAAVTPPPAGTPTPPAGTPLPPRTTTLPSAGPLPPRAPTPPAGTPYASGLAAAFTGEIPKASLGALEKLEDGALSLASVDGSDGSGPVAQPVAFAPPPGFEAPPPAEAKAKPAAPAKPERPRDEPLDLFVPPDLASDSLQVDLAPEDKPPPRPSAPELRRSQPIATVAAPAEAARAATPRRHPLADARVRLVAGVVIAILLGFLPAHIVARIREKAAFGDVDRKVLAMQADIQTDDAYEQLDTRRADLLERKYSERNSIAIMAFLIWAAAGGGIAYLWFRRMPWERLES